MKKILILLSIVFSSDLFSQPHIFYYTSFGDENDDKANCVIQSVDSGFAIVGVTNSFGAMQTDIYISRTDKLMQPKWQKTIGGFLADVGQSMVELYDSSLIIVGYSNSFGNGGYDAYFSRVNKNGDLIWQKTFGGSDWDFAYSVARTSDNNLIICGETYSFGRGENDGFILKIDYDGNIIWKKIYGGTKADRFKEIIPVSTGGYIAVGTTMSYGDDLGDIWIAKFDNQGDSVSFITHGGLKKEVGNSIVEDKDGNFLAVGGSESFTSGKEDAYLIKLTNTLSVVWNHKEGLASEDEEAYCVKNSNATWGYLLMCYTSKEVSAYKKDSKALLLDNLGYYIDGGRSGSYEDEEVFSIANCFDKGYILAGYTNSFDARQKDIYLIKYDSLVKGTGQYVVGLDKEKIETEMFWKVFPNPFSDNIFIKSRHDQIIRKVEVIDLNGNIVLERPKIDTKVVELNGLNLNSGIYVLRIITNSNTYITKVLCNR